jgi:hypothetical protein
MTHKADGLKMGDLVEVDLDYAGIWKERIFIKDAIDNGIFCVMVDMERNFKCGKMFGLCLWHDGQWRKKRKLRYRRYTWEEKEILRDKWLKLKNTNIERKVIGFDKIDGNMMVLLSGCAYGKTTGELLKDYVFPHAGEPVGVKIND